MKTWIVSLQDAGQRLDSYLRGQAPAWPRHRLHWALAHNLCRVNGTIERFASYRVIAGDSVSLHTDLISHEKELPISWEESRILYQDDIFLAYDKPAGIPSDEGGLAGLLKKDRSPLVPIHRLDKDTTGVLLFAKSKQALEAFKRLFRQFAVEKNYMAIVDGAPPTRQGTIDNYLGKVGYYDGQTLWGEVAPAYGQRACTHWNVLKKGRNASLVHCVPVTGRTHQLRVHLASIGCPILGDRQYGKSFTCPAAVTHVLLHAGKVAFPHPVSGQEILLEAELPPSFTQMMDQLRLR